MDGPLLGQIEKFPFAAAFGAAVIMPVGFLPTSVFSGGTFPTAPAFHRGSSRSPRNLSIYLLSTYLLFPFCVSSLHYSLMPGRASRESFFGGFSFSFSADVTEKVPFCPRRRKNVIKSKKKICCISGKNLLKFPIYSSIINRVRNGIHLQDTAFCTVLGR